MNKHLFLVLNIAELRLPFMSQMNVAVIKKVLIFQLTDIIYFFATHLFCFLFHVSLTNTFSTMFIGAFGF
jgi:hypothetical protein